MKILNLYAGIGGNRKLWGNEHEITAVEINPEIAAIYQDNFSNGKMVIGDAHEYLLNHYKEFDFIWSSPPCPSHSRIRRMASKKGDYEAIYPDMTLWQQIIFLKGFINDKWVVENVIPYYDPLIRHTVELDRHLFWSNFTIPKKEISKNGRKHSYIKPTDQLYGFDLSKYSINHNKVKILRNMVNPETGLYVFELAQGIIRKSNTKQLDIFEQN